ncbi:hypothetical protein F01_520132 [Burkholderia cenocepacia]|nr:hypothetical protein F01_520132 [Burkholderia cenocepacia]
MDERRARRQDRQRVRVDRHAARRPGNDDHVVPYDAAASRDGDRGRAVCVQRPRQHERNHRRHAVRRDHARRCGRQPPAERERARHRALPGQARGGTREQARVVTRRPRGAPFRRAAVRR